MISKYVITYRLPNSNIFSKTNIHANTLEEAINGFKLKGEKFLVENVANVRKITYEDIPFRPSEWGGSHDN